MIMGTQQKGRVATRQGSNGDYYGVIRGAAAVGTIGLIVEHSFHTNTRTTNWLMKESNLAHLAEEEAIVIAEYFDVLESKTPVERDMLYRVKSNAEAYLAEIKASGFDAYIAT